MTVQIENKIKALNEMFMELDNVKLNSLMQLHEHISTNPEEFEKWKGIVQGASEGDEKRIKIVNEYLSEESDSTLLKGGKTDNKTGYEWYWHTKNKIPLYPVQKLWISHDLLVKSTNLVELGALVATATGNEEVAPVIAGLALTLIVLRSKDEGHGIYIKWEPGPPVPGPAGVIVTFKGQ